jgi:hypothetical protein
VKYVIAIALLSLLTLGGCKQGEGGHCQVDSDCKEPLVCTQATMVCQRQGADDIDATVPPMIDAPMADAPMTDAPPHD